MTPSSSPDQWQRRRDRAGRGRFAPVGDLLRSQPAAESCLAKLKGADRLLAEVRALLPPPVRPHCVAASISGNALVLTVDSPAWATRLRYASSDLSDAVGRVRPTSRVCSVTVRVRPEATGKPEIRSATPKGTRLRQRLSPAAIAHLLSAADAMADPGLGETMRRLARRHAGIPAAADEPWDRDGN